MRYKKSYRRKRSYRRKKSAFQRRLRQPMNGNIRNSRVKLRLKFMFKMAVELVANAAGVFYPQVVLPLNLPGLCISDPGNATTTTLRLISASPGGVEPDLYRQVFGDAAGVIGRPQTSVFDTYKVLSLTTRFYPSSLQVNTSTTSGEPQDFAPMMYRFNDLDDSGFIAIAGNVSHLMNGAVPPYFYNRTGKPSKYVYYQLSENKSKYINTQNVLNSIAANPPLPGNNVTYGNQTFENFWGSMKLLFPCQAAAAGTTYIGDLNVVWDVILKGIPSLL